MATQVTTYAACPHYAHHSQTVQEAIASYEARGYKITKQERDPATLEVTKSVLYNSESYVTVVIYEDGQP